MNQNFFDLHELSSELLTDIFALLKTPHNICNIRLFGFKNPRSVRFGVDAITSGTSQLWQKVLSFFTTRNFKAKTLTIVRVTSEKRFTTNVG